MLLVALMTLIKTKTQRNMKKSMQTHIKKGTRGVYQIQILIPIPIGFTTVVEWSTFM